MTRTRKAKVAATDDDDYFGDAFDVSPKKAAQRPLTLMPRQLLWSGDEDRRKDLLWWHDYFENEGLIDGDAMLAELKAVLTEAFGKPVRSLHTFLEFTSKNKFPDFAWQAACWNEALARQGHAVPAADRRIPELEQSDEGDDEDE